jgi:signal transduction histidine kinase
MSGPFSLNPWSIVRELRRSFAVRLSLWYAGAFTASAVILFGLLYFLQALFFDWSERSMIQARLKECAQVYENNGISALQEYVSGSQFGKDEGPFYVEVIGRYGRVIMATAPQEWGDLRTLIPQDRVTVQHSGWLRIPRNKQSDFVIASMLLNDGASLEVGRIVSRSATLTLPFVLSFLLLMVPTLCFGIVGGAVLAYRATSPIRQVLRTAKTIVTTGNLAERVPESQAQSELADLARQFNLVLDKNQKLIRGMRETLDNVAHDLRTPMTRMRGSAELALRGDSVDGTKEALADCVEESDRVLAMLNTLMDVTEAETGMMRLQKVETSVTTLIEEVLEIYRFVAEEKGIRIETQFSGPCVASVDSARIRQVLGNLIDNAIKYTPDNGTVTLSCSDEGTGGLKVAVKDTGIGIAEDELTRIWERLYRSDKSRAQRGLGLGLSLVKAVVEAHHGQVTVESQPNQGSTFTVRL